MTTMKVAYHIGNGATNMYAVDADNAVRAHPSEWSFAPFSVDETNAWRRAQYDAEVEAAGREGRTVPPAPPEIVLTPAQRTEIDEDEKRRADAFVLVNEYDEKKRIAQEYEDTVAAARALLATPRPSVDIPPVAPGAPVAPSGPVDIPEDWRDLSIPKRRSIAQRLGAPTTVKADEADEVIGKEVERRAEQRKAELESAEKAKAPAAKVP